MTDLTARQQAGFDFILSQVCEHGRQPTYREIGEALGITSVNGVKSMLDAIEKKGVIRLRNREGERPNRGSVVEFVNMRFEPVLTNTGA